MVTIDGESDVEFREIVSGCARLFNKMLESGFAIRGAVSLGTYVRESGDYGSFVAGKALVEAYQYEQMQDWVGIMLAPSAVKANPNLQSRCQINSFTSMEVCRNRREDLELASLLQFAPNIPFHAESYFEAPTYSGYALLPNDGNYGRDGILTVLPQAIELLRAQSMFAPNPGAQRKFGLTQNFLQNVHFEWLSFAPSNLSTTR